MTTIGTKIARAKELAEKAQEARFEYQVVECPSKMDIERWLNKVGEDGWLLQHINRNGIYFFARSIAEARTLLPDLASECERRGEEVEQLKVALSNVRHGASGMCCQLRQAAEAEVSRLRALVESAPHEEDCPNDYVISTEGRVHRCTCWKRNLNQPTP